MFKASNTTPRSPLDTPDVEHECDRLEDEWRKDTELGSEIAQRKKSMGERGIKLTAVLLASRRMLRLGMSLHRLSFPSQCLMSGR